MKLCHADDLPPRHKVNRVYRSHAWRGLLWVTLIMAAICAYTLVPKSEKGPDYVLAAIPAIAGLFFGLLTLGKLRAHLHPGNWLLMETDAGLWVNLRSHLNAHLPEIGPTALFIPSEDVAAIGRTHETRIIPGHARTTTDQYVYLDIHLARGDTAALRQRLRDERRLPAPGGLLSRAKHHDYPVRILDPPGIRLAWDWIRPGEKRAFELLCQTYPAAPDRRITHPRWEKMDDGEKDRFIAETWETGHAADAVRLLRLHRQLSPRQAAAHIRDTFERG